MQNAKKGRLATSVKPLEVEGIVELTNEQAAQVNGGRKKHHRIFGLLVNPHPVFGLMVNPNPPPPHP